MPMGPLSAGAPTLCATALEVLEAKFASPTYCAVMEWPPSARLVVLKDATPPATAALPTWVKPSKKSTWPVGVPAPGDRDTIG